jgi:hypothetical protein
MVSTTAQVVSISAAALASMLVALAWVTFRVRRRNARERQTEQQAAYGAAVTGFRTAVAEGLHRRAQLVELLEVAFSVRTDRALTSSAGAAIDGSVSRLYLDLALAGDDQTRREAILCMVRRGISDVDILMPEVPLPPGPVARLGRRARRRAGTWQAARTAELDSLRALLADATQRAAATPVPAQKVAAPRVPTRFVGAELAIAS